MSYKEFINLFRRRFCKNESSLMSCFSRNALQLNSPAFLIIGAQKGGTTALYEYLSKHPQLKSSTIKETDFFSCNEIYHRGYDFYHALFAQEAGERKFFFEASPSYLHNESAPERIHAYNPRIKLVAVLRHPAERAYSAWNMYVKNYRTNVNWFQNWMLRSDANYASRQVVRRSAESLMDFLTYLNEEVAALNSGMFIEAPVLSHGFYCKQLQNYLKFFDRKQLSIIESSALKNNTIVTLRSIEDFIGIVHNNWDKCDLRPVFDGGYSTSMGTESVRFLDRYYEQANKDLSREFGIDFEPILDAPGS